MLSSQTYWRSGKVSWKLGMREVENVMVSFFLSVMLVFWTVLADDYEQDRFVNLNAFVARMTQASELREPFHDPMQVHPMDRSLRAIWVMVAALENDDVPLRELAQTAAVRVACMWFIHAADRLLAKIDFQVRCPDDFGAGPGSMFPDKEWRGHEVDRWMEWMQSLGRLKNACICPKAIPLLMDAGNMFEVMIKSPPCDVHLDFTGGEIRHVDSQSAVRECGLNTMSTQHLPSHGQSRTRAMARLIIEPLPSILYSD